MHLALLLSSLLAAAPAREEPGRVWGLLAHAGLGAYSLSVSDAGGSARGRGLVIGGGAVATRHLSPSFAVGALAELSGFLPDTAGGSATRGFLLGPAAAFRAGALALSGGLALSALGSGIGAGLGLLGAADVVVAGPVSLHGQLTWRNGFPAGGTVWFFTAELGVGLVF